MTGGCGRPGCDLDAVSLCIRRALVAAIGPWSPILMGVAVGGPCLSWSALICGWIGPDSDRFLTVVGRGRCVETG